MTELVSILVLAVVAWMMIRLLTHETHRRSHTPAPAAASTGAAPAPETAEPSGPPQPARLATDGVATTMPLQTVTPESRPARTRLFGLAGQEGATRRIDGPYAVVGYATTGFSPVRDRLVAMAVLHVDAAGRVEGGHVVHLDPDGVDLPPHLGPMADDILAAPPFAQVAPHLLSLFEGRVVVAHHAAFLESFLDARLMATGALVPSLPALCTATHGRTTFPTRNHRLTTLARHVRSRAVVGRSVLDDAYATAALLPSILRRHRGLTYPCPATGTPGGGVVLPALPPLPSPSTETTAADEWLADVFTRASGLARELGDTRVARFLDQLVPLLLTGRVVTEEVRDLTRLLVTAGYNAADLRGVQERLLESVRRSAYAQKRITRAQLLRLRATATSVGIPTYFDDLVPPERPPAPTPGSGSFSRPVRKPVAPAMPDHLPRCGHCLQIGHYTSQCPRREFGRVSAIGPV